MTQLIAVVNGGITQHVHPSELDFYLRADYKRVGESEVEADPNTTEAETETEAEAETLTAEDKKAIKKIQKLESLEALALFDAPTASEAVKQAIEAKRIELTPPAQG